MHPDHPLFELKIGVLINKFGKIVHRRLLEAEMQPCNKAKSLRWVLFPDVVSESGNIPKIDKRT
jgi:hypothetical protein